MRRGLVAKQAVLVAVAIAICFMVDGAAGGIAALCGGVIAVINVHLLNWRKRESARTGGLGANASLRIVYRSAIERFAVVASLFAVGLGVLDLAPVPVLAGFVAGQVAVVFLWLDLGQPTKKLN